MKRLDFIDAKYVKRDSKLKTGDSVRVHLKIREGEKERVQVFEGIVISQKRGRANASFTVRKVSYGIGVERIFPLHSPLIQKIEINSHGKVRRAKLSYLRQRSGKRARIAEKSSFSLVKGKASDEAGSSVDAAGKEVQEAEDQESTLPQAGGDKVATDGNAL